MLNTASGMCYYGKLREGQRQTSLTREGLFLYSQKQVPRSPPATPCLEPVDYQCSVHV